MSGDDHNQGEGDAIRRAAISGAANALWNQANNVGFAINQGRLDGTNGAAVAAAIRATTPEEFAKACGEVSS